MGIIDSLKKAKGAFDAWEDTEREHKTERLRKEVALLKEESKVARLKGQIRVAERRGRPKEPSGSNMFGGADMFGGFGVGGSSRKRKRGYDDSPFSGGFGW